MSLTARDPVDGDPAMLAPGARRMRQLGMLKVHSLRAGDIHVIELDGELDIAGAPAVERALKRAEACGASTVVLDLRRLRFIDTSGLRVVVLAHRRRAGRLALVRGSPAVQRVFEICGLAQRLPFVDETPGASNM